jgi:hypothetical protein
MLNAVETIPLPPGFFCEKARLNSALEEGIQIIIVSHISIATETCQMAAGVAVWKVSRTRELINPAMVVS